MPCLLLFNKDGKNFISLTNEEIEKINSEKIKGWKNTFSLANNFKKRVKYFIGLEGAIFPHKHILFYSIVGHLGFFPISSFCCCR